MITVFLELFLRWLKVGSRAYRSGAPKMNTDPNGPTETYPGHGFTDDFSIATDSPTSKYIQL
jgi:hypothetical protein